MDYGALPPEFNSARMYAGPGSAPMLAAASAWSGLAAELNSTASSYASAITELVSGPWVGPSSTAMAAAVEPYVTWLGATAGQAELAGTQARAAAGAFDAAFAMTVPPPLIAENRAQLMMLIATNFLGQNSAAIAATEAEYAEMWAQDAAAMYGYAANSAAATAPVTPFSPAPATTNQSGVAAQGAASAQASSTPIGSVQSALSGFISQISQMLQNLSSPLSSALTGSSSGTSADVTNPFGGVVSTSGLSYGSIAGSLIAEYGYLPGFFAVALTGDALGPLMNPDVFLPFMNMGAAPLGAGAAAAAPAALGSGLSGGFGGLAGLGQAASVGGLSVPAGWGWAAGGPGAALGQVPLEMLAAPMATPLEAGLGSGFGFPFMFGPLERAAAVGATAGAAGAAAAKYGPRLKVLSRSPAAGYAAEPPAAAAPLTPKYPPPTGLPTNGHAPPGYQPAIVYVPINGHVPSDA